MTQVFKGSRSQSEPQFPRLRNRPGAAGEDPDPAVHTVGTRVGGEGGGGEKSRPAPPSPAPPAPPQSRRAQGECPRRRSCPATCPGLRGPFAGPRPSLPGPARLRRRRRPRAVNPGHSPASRAVPRLRPEEKEGRARQESPAHTSAEEANRSPLRQATAPPMGAPRQPIKRSSWRARPIRSCRSVPAVGKEPRRSLESGGAVVGGTRGLTGSALDQWRGAGGGWGR